MNAMLAKLRALLRVPTSERQEPEGDGAQRSPQAHGATLYPPDLAYYLYLSGAKLDMLAPQIAATSGEVPSVENRFADLRLVIDELDRRGLVGDPTSGADYVSGELEMRWAPVDWGTSDRLRVAFFIATDQDPAILMAGSVAHLHPQRAPSNMVKAGTFGASGSDLPGIMRSIKTAFEHKGWDWSRTVSGLDDYLFALLFAQQRYLSSTRRLEHVDPHFVRQRLRFLARRLVALDRPSDVEIKAFLDNTRISRLDRRLVQETLSTGPRQILVCSPIYVAQADSREPLEVRAPQRHLPAGPPLPWATATIRIGAATTPGNYPVELQMHGGRLFPGDLSISTAGLLEAEMEPDRYGRILGSALFAERAIGVAYREALAANQGSLAVQLQVDAADLVDVFWERMLQPIAGQWHPISRLAATPFARRIYTQSWSATPQAAGRTLRMLVAIASPPTLPSYGLIPIAQSEIRSWQQLFADLHGVQATVLTSTGAQPPTLRALRTALAEGYDVCHIVCHGKHIEEVATLFLDADGDARSPTPGDKLVSCLRELSHPPQLVTLISCTSADAQNDRVVLPLGAELVRHGNVPTALAVKGQIQAATARLLAEQFYRRLIAHGRPDLALNEARASIQDQWDWGAPVLFSRLDHVRLIQKDHDL